MNTIIEKPISPKYHALIDYALVGSLLALPSLLGMNKKAKVIYAAEALVSLPYVALTKHPRNAWKDRSVQCSSICTAELIQTFPSNEKGIDL